MKISNISIDQLATRCNSIQLKSEKSFQDYWYVTPYIYPPARHHISSCATPPGTFKALLDDLEQ